MPEQLSGSAGLAQATLETEIVTSGHQMAGANVFDRLRNRWSALIAASATTLAVIISPALNEQPAQADTPQAVIGMPFQGQWAYDANVDPPYTDSNSSHPSVHESYTADWATDIYAAPGTDAKLKVNYANDNFTYNVSSVTDTSCGAGKRVRVSVKSGTSEIGWVQYDHLETTITAGTILTADSVLGKTKNWGNLPCYAVSDDAGVHLHVGMKNSQNYSCYIDFGNPGKALNEGDDLGVIGSPNNGLKQACAEVPSGRGASEQLAEGTFVRINESGAIYRIVGGAPIRIYNPGALPDFNGQVTNISHARLGELPRYPKDEGAIINLVEAGGAKYRFVGGAPVRIYNCAALPGNCVGAISVNFQSLVEHDHMLQRPKDGAALSIAEAGGAGIYRFVGGAPIRLFNWGAIPDMPPVITVNDQSLAEHDHMNTRPSDGSIISLVEAGGAGIYRFVGGAPIRLFNWGAIPDMPNVVTVNSQSLSAHDHMNERPTDGSTINIVEAGGAGIYRFVGGAPLRLFNWGIIPGSAGTVNVNEQSLAAHDHMNTLPVNGEFIVSVETGIVYRVAGGAAIRLYNHGAIPGFSGAVFVNQQTLDTVDHLRTVPLNGTIIRGVSSNTYWRINDGKRTQVGPDNTAVIVDEQSIADFPIS